MSTVQWLLLILAPIVISIVTAGHALLHKRDPHAAMGWIAVCVLFPVAGPILYLLFGINRIRTRAKQLDLRAPGHHDATDPILDAAEPVPATVSAEFSQLDRIARAASDAPLLGGNHIGVLQNGDEAYPVMLKAIREARSTVHLATYIFGVCPAGQDFLDALSDATARGVDVRVLIDGFGELYDRRRAAKELKKRGVRVARFLPPKLIPPMIHMNLRNHRKILVCDGEVAFTGGMNIRECHVQASSCKKHYTDLHFRLTGPVVWQLERVFREDWRFVTREDLPSPPPCAPHAQGAVCRTIADGPSEHADRLAHIIAGAVGAARETITIVTPYFLPSRELIGALVSAALKGVRVTVLLPAECNIPIVHRATRKMLWELVDHGVHVHYQPPPFAHTKLFIVDSHYTQIGSANIDPRSLRLNFEVAVEVYDSEFATQMTRYTDEILIRSKRVTMESLDARPLHTRLLDAIAWLFSPML